VAAEKEEGLNLQDTFLVNERVKNRSAALA
jgi:hypothetical protein